jgi:protoporphyrinogen/coproporphyrinogen III oxidase
MPHIAVVGGGITGLSTAYHLIHTSEGVPLQVTLIEASDRLGGKIRTERFAGTAIDLGPEALVARVPQVRALCRELGLEEDLVAPATGKTYLWTRGRLRPFPDGLVFGVPTSAGAIARSGILSLAGVARAGLDLLLPRSHWPSDPSITQVIGSRFGREVVERLVEPLLGGIHAGRADRLSLASVAPYLAIAAKQHRSLMRGLQSTRPAKEGGSSPVLLTVAGGLERLVERLHKALAGVDIRTGTHVLSITPLPDGRYRLLCDSGSAVVADGVVLAVPSWAAADIVRETAPELATRLASIAYASVVTVTLGYPTSAFPKPLNGSGFLVPRIDGRLLTACTWCTNKWPHLRSSTAIILRCSAGRWGDDRALQLDDDALIEQLQGELVQSMGIRGHPNEWLITRWKRAIPQYEVGHQARVAEIEAALAGWPGIILAGAPYHGVGIASCIQDSELAASLLRTHLACQITGSHRSC